MKHYAIIVAGGKGERMRSAVPKQFLELAGRPMIMRTLELFQSLDTIVQLILVLPAGFIGEWKHLCAQYSFDVAHVVAEGGPARFHSVKSGLKHVTDEQSLVAVHDAVRPLVPAELISRVFKEANIYGSAIPVIPVTDSLREWHDHMNRPVDRRQFFHVQTPQCFKTPLIKKAYLQNYREEFTDDAGVLESNGGTLHMVEGHPENIKITTPADLIFAEALLKSREKGGKQ